MQSVPSSAAVRVGVRVTGVVQGVGFRPFVHRLARDLQLAGHVGNDAAGVFCEVEGPVSAVADFLHRLVADAPPLARIESVTDTTLDLAHQRGFAIVASRPAPGGVTLVSADLAPCSSCLGEMADPADRRHRYPLLNCTDCGPRFTITRTVPYDRPATTLAAFPMCADCRAEYEDPGDRRFHAQPTACPACGPAIWLEHPVGDRGSPAGGTDPVQAAAGLVADGAILAIKGVGGYHLACRADDHAAVQRLRERKQRPHKPLAVMVADVASARLIARVSPAEAALLDGPERPIVLLRTLERTADRLSPAVAPGNRFIGVMLPASPLHTLLIKPGETWVMTSGNISGTPICTDDDDARCRLGPIADATLGHDRPIHVPCDDSVVRVIPARPAADEPHATLMPVRRSRGYAPYPIPVTLPPGPTILAVGGELKATFCLRRDDHAFMGAHIGDMENLETIEAFERSVEHTLALFRTPRPDVLACDAHPGYASTRWAHAHADGRPVVEVQHHHAHLAALMAEHRISGPIIGFAFDGTGYGADGTIWGGEVLLADLAQAQRIGHLRPSLLAGGDAAVRHPRRQALARLHEAGIAWDEDLPCVAATSAAERRVLAAQLQRGLGTVATSSMGRLFDAVASLCDVRQEITYEGQAAIELEALIDPDQPVDADEPAMRASPHPVGTVFSPEAPPGYTIDIDESGVWDAGGLIAGVVRDVRRGRPVSAISASFHNAVADAIVEAACRARAAHGVDVVGLSGGVFANVALSCAAVDGLRARGLHPLVHRLVPCNDGGLALGQAAVAAHVEA